MLHLFSGVAIHGISGFICLFVVVRENRDIERQCAKCDLHILKLCFNLIQSFEIASTSRRESGIDMILNRIQVFDTTFTTHFEIGSIDGKRNMAGNQFKQIEMRAVETTATGCSDGDSTK